MKWKKAKFETRRDQRDELVRITPNLTMRRARFVGVTPADDPGCTLVITTNGRFVVSEPFAVVEACVYGREA